MTDNEKRAHDIAVALLPIALSETNSPVYVEASDSTMATMTVDSFSIHETYLDIYESMLEEMS